MTPRQADHGRQGQKQYSPGHGRSSSSGPFRPSIVYPRGRRPQSGAGGGGEFARRRGQETPPARDAPRPGVGSRKLAGTFAGGGGAAATGRRVAPPGGRDKL